jgi:integrase/recombinase XerD
VRPRAPYREVFLRLKAPFGPLSSGVLYDVVSDRLRSLALPLRHYGPHALRHACATRLLAQGLSLKEIGDHLGQVVYLQPAGNSISSKNHVKCPHTMMK